VDFTSETKTPAAILSLDQEKAFDRVDWAFLFRILANFGLGASFISWVTLLYTNIRSAVLVNGYSSDYFWPSRGVRQGCSLSPLLYVISIEVLAVNLRYHPDIIGLQIPGSSSSLPTVALYADDTSVIVNLSLPFRLLFQFTNFLKEVPGQSSIFLSVRVCCLVRALSLAGRALVVNGLKLSRVWYVASLIHMPAWVCSEL